MIITTIEDAITAYLDSVQLARSENTARTYKNALRIFKTVLKEYWVEPKSASCEKLTEDAITWLATYLKTYAAPTERLYLTAVAGFYEYVAAERLADINLPRLRLLIRQRARRPGIRLPQFPVEDLEKVLTFVGAFKGHEFETDDVKLRALRDRAFLFTLADTGLRVSEACSLRRGDVDWNEGRAVIIGKGDKQAVVRFSERSLRTLRDYLSARSRLDGAFNRPLGSLALFARHDKGAGKKIKPITTATGRNIVNQRVSQALGPEAVGTITPHSFRHYFVTTILRASGNLKLAQELARHANIQVTQRYAHLSDDELDRGYHAIFENKDGLAD
ncbi:MAG: tyrosine-type recombinase/integrase [Anaerolineae bacterium]|nr:tyrosine-type recombinase/integrase [Anaerolineae bacterium]